MEEGTTKVTNTTSKLQFFWYNGIECSYPSMYTTNYLLHLFQIVNHFWLCYDMYTTYNLEQKEY